MDPRLLRLYGDELSHLREVGAEFAREFPKVAGRLSMDGVDVADPYVERLLEGVAFLTARVQLKMEAEQPRLIAHLLESIYPNFLAPVPSMLVARFDVDPLDPNLRKGFTLPRGSAVVSTLARGQDTHCEFRTAHAVPLWPLELVRVQAFSHAPDLPLSQLPIGADMRGGLRLTIRTGGGVPLRELGLDRLALHISAPDDVAFRLHELVHGAALGSWVGGAPASGQAGAVPAARQWRGPDSISPLGFAADEALLPETPRSFSGHRLLQELAALPQRFLFFEVTDLAARLAHVQGDEAELVLLFSRADAGLEPLVDAQSLALFCTPAINLFRKRLDRIQPGPGAWEYHVVADRTRPADYEVHSLESVVGFGGAGGGAGVGTSVGRSANATAPQTFHPLYASFHDEPAGGLAYYTVRREPRLLSERQRQHGPRSGYVGEEMFLSLTDARHAPYRDDIRQLSVSAWVSNRDLPTLLPQGAAAVQQQGASAAADTRWQLDAPGPVARVHVLRGPTRPVSRRPVGEVGWSLVSHLSLNHTSLTVTTPERAATAVRQILALYGPPGDVAWARQLDGLRRLTARTVVRRLPFPGPLTFGTGIELGLEVDELAFQGASAFLVASVLEHWFARHAGINSFTQLSLASSQRGSVMRWPPRVGVQETV